MLGTDANHPISTNPFQTSLDFSPDDSFTPLNTLILELSKGIFKWYRDRMGRILRVWMYYQFASVLCTCEPVRVSLRFPTSHPITNNYNQERHNKQMSILEIIDPPIQKFEERNYPLEPDLLNGWKIKLKGFKQTPIKYTYPPVDRLVKEYTQLNQPKAYRVVYLGPRHNTNLRVIRAYCHKQYDARLKEAFLYSKQDIPKYPYSKCKEKDIIMSLEDVDNRIFTGMNPTLDCEDELIFDSDFECGNLDMVMKIAKHQYDLFMRVDSNTRGHTSWYFFKLKNTRKGRIVKLNICNFHKKDSLYTKGLKPYVFSRLDGRGWHQAPGMATYQRKPLRYKQSKEHSKPLYCLSFTYEFQSDYDEIYFSYGIPYSYSYLLKFIDALTQVPSHRHFLKYEKKYESASGLSVPVLTITNPKHEHKKVVLITGRLHPGEAQGSWVLHGFINFLCSPQADPLRSIAIFKIIPMVNVDGVVLGNFRTSLRGADLNRKFKIDAESLLKDDEVGWVKNLAYEYNKNIHTYLDFHGHSTNKGAFLYGPQYPMNHQHYFNCRLFPKIISKQTEMFRYYSCSFRIPKNKQTTARAIMFRQNNVPFCFTIQTSNHSFHSQEGGELSFSQELFQRLGGIIGSKQQQFMCLLNQIEAKKEEMKLCRKGKGRVNKMGKYKSTKRAFFGEKSIKSDMVRTVSNPKPDKEVEDTDEQQLSAKQIIEEVYELHNFLAIKQEIEEQKLEVVKAQAQCSESSDCETAGEDYTQEELEKLLNVRAEDKRASPEPYSQKHSKIIVGKKRSISFRLPPADPSKQFCRKGQLQPYKLSPKTLSLESHSAAFVHDFMIERNKIRRRPHKTKDIAIPHNSQSKVARIRKIEHIQSEKSRQLRSQQISMQLKDRIEHISGEKNECFIYRHMKMLVFPELTKSPASNRNMKGYQKREIHRAADSELRKELIGKRNSRSFQLKKEQLQE